MQVWNELKEDELFPFEISTQTYHYVKKLLKETNDRKNKVIIQKTVSRETIWNAF